MPLNAVTDLDMKGTRSGRLTVVLIFLLSVSISVQSADVTSYKITKGIRYQQLPGGSPVVLTENGYVFQADVYLVTAGAASAATVVSTEGTVRTLTFDKPDK